MKYKLKFFVLLFFYSTISNACLHTYQFKVFPVGISNEQIITVDAQINRRGYRGKDKNDELGSPKIMWIIRTYISVYDKNQKLVSSKLINTEEVKQQKYLANLQSNYEKCLELIKENYKTIDFFKPQYISYCDFQQKCEIIEAKRDTVNNQDFIKYKNKKYGISVINDSTYYGFKESAYFVNNLSLYSISSTRIYRTESYELVIGHFGSGHELSMGWMTNDPNRKPKDEYDVVIYSKEHKPKLEFTSLENSIYEEPLLHHGYGFDIFFVTKNN